MNLYFIVEGRRTEARVYPRWFTHLLPNHNRVQAADEAATNSYYLISGEGYPNLLYETLPDAIETILSLPTCDYRYLILCLDADEATVEERINEVLEAYQENPLPDVVNFRVVVQNRCIESWFLGNRRIFPRNPQNSTLRGHIGFYNVADNCPEEMGYLPAFRNHAHFHEDYLRLIFQERNLSYSKQLPGQVQEEHYLNQLIARSEDSALQTFGQFIALCREIRNMSSTTGS